MPRLLLAAAGQSVLRFVRGAVAILCVVAVSGLSLPAQLPIPIATVACAGVGTYPCAPPAQPACAAAVDTVAAKPCAADTLVAVAAPVAPAPRGTVTELRDWQVAYFRRGSGALVVAAFDVSRDKLFWEFLSGWGTVPLGGPRPAPWSAGLYAPTAASLDGDTTGGPISAVVEGPPRAKWITAITASWDSLPLALDLIAPADPSAPIPAVRSGAIGQARLTAQPPPQPSQRVQVSDILLYEPDDRAAPMALDGGKGAMPRALGTTTLGGRQRIGLYWETYGLEAGDSTAIELTALPVRGPGKTDERAPSGLGWQIDAPGGVQAGMPHGFVLDVKTLKPGWYDLVVTVSVPGQESVSVARRVRVEIDSGW